MRDAAVYDGQDSVVFRQDLMLYASNGGQNNGAYLDAQRIAIVNQTLLGLVIFFVGLGLIAFSQPLAGISKRINDKVSVAWPLKFYRIMNVIAGILFLAYGLLMALGLARFPPK